MKKEIAIIGSGPSALMLASMLKEELFSVTIYERKAAPARKFLVAGEGGFNLTHSEPTATFIQRYTPSSFFEKIISSFSNTDLIAWLESIGIPTYIGSSKRVFPVKGIKPIEVLNAILKKLEEKKVKTELLHEWQGWNEKNELVFFSNKEHKSISAEIVVFALGGGSWSVTGSDGSWTKPFAEKGIDIIPFQASNCAYTINWPASLLIAAEGESLKNISIACGNNQKKGEVVITKTGLEGGAVYALSPQIREQLATNKTASLLLDLKPALSEAEIVERLSTIKGNSTLTKTLTNKIKLTTASLALLKTYLSKEEFTNVKTLANKIKNFPLTITGVAPIDEAISTVGGISLATIDENFQLKKLPGHYAIGEMLNWDAPTGGYLLQACFSMGHKLAEYLNRKAKE